MSIFGLLVGLFIIGVIFYYEKQYINLPLDNVLGKDNKKESFQPYYPWLRTLFGWPSVWYGPYWNTVYRPSMWMANSQFPKRTVDDDHIWPYWVWTRKLPYRDQGMFLRGSPNRTIGR